MSKAILSATITLAVGTLFIAGCATKNYVKQSIQPVDQKIDQVDKSSQIARFLAGRRHQQDESGCR